MNHSELDGPDAEMDALLARYARSTREFAMPDAVANLPWKVQLDQPRSSRLSGLVAMPRDFMGIRQLGLSFARLGLTLAVAGAFLLLVNTRVGGGTAANLIPPIPSARPSNLAAAAGTDVAYAWTSENADSATSTVTISPGPDACGNHDGPWVVATLTGTTDPIPLLPCQSGFSYTLSVEVTQTATGATASSAVTIAVD